MAIGASIGLTALARGPLAALPLRWSTLDPMPLAVFDAAGGLSDGWIVVSGGFGEDLAVTPAIQVRHEARGWRPISTQMSQPRARHTQTTLSDGKVLVVGGVRGSLRPDAADPPSPLASAEVFHPLIAGTDFIAIGEPLVGHSAHLLPDGRVAVIGGSWVRLYDPAVEGFSEAIRLRHERRGHASVVWTRTVYPPATPSAAPGETTDPDHRLVEQELSIDMVPTARGASIGATMEPQQVPVVKAHQSETHSTRVVLLIIGGDQDSTIEEVDLANASSRLWEARLPVPTADACAAVMADGRVLVIGGVDGGTGQSLATSWWLDAHETILPGPDFELGSGAAAATCFLDSMDGSVFLFGGERRNSTSIEPVKAGRMMRPRGERRFTLPIPDEPAAFARRSWIRLNDRQVAAVGGYRFVDATTAAAERIAPGVHVRGIVDAVRMPSPVGGD